MSKKLKGGVIMDMGPYAASIGRIFFNQNITYSKISFKKTGDQGLHETKVLKLDSSKARQKLGWTPKWDVQSALEKTADWYNSWKSFENMFETCSNQIDEYERHE